MAVHSHVKIWVHLIWTTHKRERILNKDQRPKVFDHLIGNAERIGLHLEQTNIQPEHVHTLLCLPSDKAIESVAHDLKGESSRWINENDLIRGKFRWQRGYGVFSVSASQVESVKNYIKNQDEHHRRKTFAEEYHDWKKRYGTDDGE